MALNSIGTRTSFLALSLVNMRQQLEDLQTQLAPGKKADTYAGMGISRGFGIGLRAQLTALDSYADTILNVDTRLNIAHIGPRNTGLPSFWPILPISKETDCKH